MAYAFRQVSTQGDASGAAITVTKPTGTVDGDLILVVAYLETDTNSWSSVGAGFNVWAAAGKANTGAFLMQVWWKIAASEPASWTWTPTATAWRGVTCASYSGGTGSGAGRTDVANGSQADAVADTSQTAPSITTTAAHDLLAYCYGNFNGVAVTGMSGACTNLRGSIGGTTIADALDQAQGATGTSNETGVGTADYAASHASFFLDTGGGAFPFPPWPRRVPVLIY